MLTSDSGRLVILSFSKELGRFERVHSETYGKSGVRRIVPGQFLAVEPKGRAVMIAAVEKAKLVYVLNREAGGALTISSPLEAHKSATLCFSLVALDRGFDDPQFAAIELGYGEADADPSGVAAASAQKHLTIYELSLGLNHVVRKWSEPCDNGANLLVGVPCDPGPGGVLLCSENFVTYKTMDGPDVAALIPRRADLPGDRGVLITAGAAHRTKDGCFFLLQSEYGDVYKAVLGCDAAGKVAELRLSYFDTVPVANCLAILRSGFLFSASEWGPHGFYQLTGIGDEAEGASSSAGMAQAAEGGGYAPVFFTPRRLKNLTLLDEPPSLAPILCMLPEKADKGGGEAGALHCACGSGARSRLATLRPGVAATQLAVSPLPAPPAAVWTVRKRLGDAHDAYIVVAFANATVVLAVGDAVEEVADSGFAADAASLAVGCMDDDSLVQVHALGLRHVLPDKRVQEWRAPGRKSVAKVALNGRQVVLALSGGELVYFELDAAARALADVERRDTGGDVAALALGPVPAGSLRAPLLALGSYDGSVRILSLSPDAPLSVLGVLACAASPDSLLLLPTPGGQLHLCVGLASGVFVRAAVDPLTGSLGEARKRVLGTKPVRLCGVKVGGEPAALALSSRPWLLFSDAASSRPTLAPLSYDPLVDAAPFSSAATGEGVVAIARDSTLRVFSLEPPQTGRSAFNASFIPLRFTPRSLVAHPSRPGVVAVCEADAGVAHPHPTAVRDVPSGAPETALQSPHAPSDAPLPPPPPPPPPPSGAPPSDGGDVSMGDDGAPGDASAPPNDPGWSHAEQFGHARAAPGSWASCIRLVDTRAGATTHLVSLPPGEAALCCCVVKFPNYEETLLAVGIAVGLAFAPRRAACGAISLFRFLKDGRLELLQKTALDAAPTALCSYYGGRLLVGAGRALRMYDLGKRKLLRKAEAADFPNTIVTLHTQAERIFAGDMQEALHFVRFRAEDNAFTVFAEDTAPRWLTAAAPLDYNSVAGADKFGNVFISRLSAEAAEEQASDTGGSRAAPHKLLTPNVVHVGAAVRCLATASLQPQGAALLLFATLLGGVGALYPFTQREDVDFAQQLEMHMRQEAPPLAGRDHLAYRGAFFPVKDVVDGDLCELFASLPTPVQRRVAEDMERTPADVLLKLEALRARFL